MRARLTLAGQIGRAKADPIIPAKAGPTRLDKPGLRRTVPLESDRLVSGPRDDPKVHATIVRGSKPNSLRLRGLHHGPNQRRKGISDISKLLVNSNENGAGVTAPFFSPAFNNRSRTPPPTDGHCLSVAE
jgi:hypothetical protein